MNQPGLIALLGSGETSAVGGQIFEWIASRLSTPLSIRVLETPAGFELNANRVAGRVAEFLSARMQNYHPDVKLIPARRRGTADSPDSPSAIRDLLDAQMIFMGPGSPSYAVRQLQGSLAWEYIRILHRQGAAIVLASAATIALGNSALPVYEIYKVGEDPYWKPGLDFFNPYGLDLVFIPHWNNAEGGTELDTSRCFMGRERFDLLYPQLPSGTTVIGLDEHTGLIIDLVAEQCQVMGRSQVHLISDGQEHVFNDGEHFDIRLLGKYHPLQDEHTGIAPETWQKVTTERAALLQPAVQPLVAPIEVQKLLELRQVARQAKNWHEADVLRDQILALGWKVVDTSQGPSLVASQ
jgi:cyanophycinase-like exopeptidase